MDFCSLRFFGIIFVDINFGGGIIGKFIIVYMLSEILYIVYVIYIV